MKKSASTGDRLIPGIFSASLLIIWELAVESGIVPKYVLPSPSDVLTAFFQDLPVMAPHILITVKEALVGFITAVAFSVVLAVLMDSIAAVKKAVYPILVVSQTVPIIALAPLFVIWFGWGQLPKVIVVILVCFFPIVISLLEGLSSVDPDMLNLLRSMGARRIQIFRLLKFPASAVNFFSGLRIAATYSIMGAVIGEWLGGEKGLGLYMLRVKHSYALDRMFAAILAIVVLSMILFKLITLLQDVSMPWNRLLNKSR